MKRLMIGLGLLVLVGLSACAQTQEGTEDVYKERPYRTYASDVQTVVEAVSEAMFELGLQVEGGETAGSNEYLVRAKRMVDMGGRDPVQVARIDAYVERVEAGETRVRVETEKISRTSMVAQSSGHRRDYQRRIFEKLDKRLR